jgi:hypothetical protein
MKELATVSAFDGFPFDFFGAVRADLCSGRRRLMVLQDF